MAISDTDFEKINVLAKSYAKSSMQKLNIWVSSMKKEWYQTGVSSTELSIVTHYVDLKIQRFLLNFSWEVP